MYRTIEAVVHPDGTVEPLEPVTPGDRRRGLLIILDEAPPTTPDWAAMSDADRLDAALRAAGLLADAADLPADLTLLSETELDALWSRTPAGTPLSQIISEEREDRC